MASRQEEAFDYVAQTFLKLIQKDKTIPHKKEVMAFWHDFFEHEGVRNNMIQAFSNLLWEIDGKIENAKAVELLELQKMVDKVADPENENTKKIKTLISKLIDEKKTTIKFQSPDELLDEVGDLSEVGGGNEDDTPLI